MRQALNILLCKLGWRSQYIDWTTGWTFRTSDPCRVKEFVFSSICPNGSWDHPPSFQKVVVASSAEVNRATRGGDLSLPFSAAVKNEWKYTSTSHMCCYSMLRNNFIYFFTNSHAASGRKYLPFFRPNPQKWIPFERNQFASYPSYLTHVTF